MLLSRQAVSRVVLTLVSSISLHSNCANILQQLITSCEQNDIKWHSMTVKNTSCHNIKSVVSMFGVQMRIRRIDEITLMVEGLYTMVSRRVSIRRKQVVLLSCIAVVFGLTFYFNGLETGADVYGYK